MPSPTWLLLAILDHPGEGDIVLVALDYNNFLGLGVAKGWQGPPVWRRRRQRTHSTGTALRVLLELT